MYNRFNNFQLDLQERVSVARSFSIATGVNSAEKLKEYLWKVIHNENANRKLYYRLLDAGLNKPVLIRDQALEILPGKFIDIYFVLRDANKSAPRGQQGVDNSIFKKSRINISLYANLEDDYIEWRDTYPATIDHELTHTFQSMDIAVRYLLQKNRKFPNYQPNYDDIIKLMTRINDKNRKFNTKFKGLNTDFNIALDYISSDREMGARAHAFLRQLYSKDKNLFNDVISYCEHGWPTFDYLNRKLSKGNWHGWSDLDNLSRNEIKALGYKEEETNGFALKYDFLDKAYDWYTTQYKQ